MNVTNVKVYQTITTELDFDGNNTTIVQVLAGNSGPAGPTGATGPTGASFGDVQFNRRTANYTLTITDVNKIIEMNIPGNNTLTVPPASSVAFPIGTTIGAAQYGVGQTTLTAGSGVTLRSRGGALRSAGQYARWKIEKVSANEWYVSGDLVI